MPSFDIVSEVELQEVRNAIEVSVAMDRSVNLVMLHDPGHSLEERILREQFGD